MAPSAHPADSSVFPIEVYERILEEVIDTNEDDVWMWKYTLRQCSLVCRAWRWKCLLLRSRILRFSEGEVRDLYHL